MITEFMKFIICFLMFIIALSICTGIKVESIDKEYVPIAIVFILSQIMGIYFILTGG